MIPMLDLSPQHGALRDELDAAVAGVLESGQFVLGPNVTAFEREAANHLGAAQAVSCASGTDALHLALRALGIGTGDEVITTPFTFAATTEAVRHAGARPVFADIHERTFNLDPKHVARAITPATRAILPVHLFGQPAAMDALLPLARRHGLHVVEDAAQAFGARHRGRAVGTLGAAGCFSFFPTKNLGGCGDGGLITTADAVLAERLRALRNHGSTRRDRHPEIGYNSRLDELQAAILRVKLPHLERYNANRQRVAQRYRDGLTDLPGVVTPLETDDGTHVYHQYTLLVPRRDAVRDALHAQGVGCAVYYARPLHHQRAFAADHDGTPLPVAEDVAERCLSLPCYPGLDDTRIDAVIAAVRHAVAG